MKNRKLAAAFAATGVVLAGGLAVGVGAVASAGPVPPVATEAVAAMAVHSAEAAHSGAVEAQLVNDVSTFQKAQAGVTRHDEQRAAVLATAQFAATEGPKRIQAAKEAAAKAAREKAEREKAAKEAREKARSQKAANPTPSSPSPSSPSPSSQNEEPYTPSGDSIDAHLARIAQCESGGNPRALSPGGTYRGMFQFLPSTWRSVGGTGDPAAASVAEQYKRARILYERSGPGQWPVCSRR